MVGNTKYIGLQAGPTSSGMGWLYAATNISITPYTYDEYEAIKAQLAMVNSPNHTTIYIPVGPMSVPLVGTPAAVPPTGK